MAWHSLGTEAEIKRIFDFVIQRGTNIEVRIPGEDETFFSRVDRVLPPSGKPLKDAGGELQLALKNLSPETGNHRIRTSPAVEIFFSFRQFLCRFRSDVLSGNGLNSEILIGYPELLEVEEKRKEERLYPEFPDFLSAVLTYTDKNRETRTYDLRVLNYSRHGLGLLVEEDAYPLLGELNQGDFIPEITLFGEAVTVRLSAFVRHKSEISEGPFAGSYVVGLESEAGLEEHLDDLSSQSASTSAS
ncbi:MAG: hypothetical protein CVU64_11325 [Deltaproteobacteria bacterium HGW-Deltaproteobacteria-21]|nr:MAG: hypothetical protein CVU64_11325 [Deltaproteobacteria bacterium HGW-Deltaproteobacteria-21]